MKNFGRKKVGRKQVGRKVGARIYIHVRGWKLCLIGLWCSFTIICCFDTLERKYKKHFTFTQNNLIGSLSYCRVQSDSFSGLKNILCAGPYRSQILYANISRYREWRLFRISLFIWKFYCEEFFHTLLNILKEKKNIVKKGLYAFVKRK